jgi:predicted nuclease of predicted toxin-antitoxin system
MRILIDVNLSPTWVTLFASRQMEAIHWTSVGNPRATDEVIIAYAREHEYVVFTHDLDFGTLLALTRAVGPSVLQVRAQNVLPAAIGELVVRVVTEQKAALEAGALVTVDERHARVRILPVR